MRRAARRLALAIFVFIAVAAGAGFFSQPAVRATTSAPAKNARAPGLPRGPLPQVPLSGTAGASGSGGVVPFAALTFAILLAIPNAVRWLRAALALGLSPAYVAPGDRPG